MKLSNTQIRGLSQAQQFTDDNNPDGGLWIWRCWTERTRGGGQITGFGWNTECASGVTTFATLNSLVKKGLVAVVVEVEQKAKSGKVLEGDYIFTITEEGRKALETADPFWK